MLAEMPVSLWWEWMAYAHIEPFGEERADLRSAIVASVIANANRDTKKHPLPFPVRDFLPDFTGERKVKKWEDHLRMVEMLNRALGGKDERTDEKKAWRH